ERDNFVQSTGILQYPGQVQSSSAAISVGVRNIYVPRPSVQRKAGPTINRGDRMRRLTRFLPLALAIAALSIPIMALAQDMTMGPLATRENPPLGTTVTDLNGRTDYSWAGDTAGAGTSN